MMQSGSSAEVQVQSQAQAVANEASANPSFGAPAASTQSSLLQSLQERAHAGWQATAQIVTEHTNIVKQAASDRVETARAGKNLLDEGGELAAQAVAAKKASVVASEIDRGIANRVHVAIIKLDSSVSNLRAAHSARPSMETDDISDLNKIATEHEARAATLREVAQMLERPTSSAEMSQEETDALAIMQAKAGYATVLSKASVGLDSIKQKTLASMSYNTTPIDNSAHESAPQESATHPAASPAPTLLQGLKENALSSLENVKQVATDRLNTARTGKRLLDDGGEAVAQLVVAKEATLEAADIDRNIAQRAHTASVAFDDSASKLRALQSDQDGEVIMKLKLGHRLELAEEHESRADTYRKIADMLQAPVASLSMNLAEWDALKLVKVKDGCGVLQRRTNEGFEAVKSLTFSGCAAEVEDADQRRRRAVCA